MREPLHRLSAVKLAQLITAGEASPETVTRSFIDAIHERERDVQSFAWFDADRAIAAAREVAGTFQDSAQHVLGRGGPELKCQSQGPDVGIQRCVQLACLQGCDGGNPVPEPGTLALLAAGLLAAALRRRPFN